MKKMILHSFLSFSSKPDLKDLIYFLKTFVDSSVIEKWIKTLALTSASSTIAPASAASSSNSTASSTSFSSTSTLASFSRWYSFMFSLFQPSLKLQQPPFSRLLISPSTAIFSLDIDKLTVPSSMNSGRPSVNASSSSSTSSNATLANVVNSVKNVVIGTAGAVTGAVTAAAAADSGKVKETKGNQKEKEKKEVKKEEAKEEVPQSYRIDVRVAEFLEITDHPSDARLFVCELNLGNELGKRKVVSGLRDYYSKEALLTEKYCCCILNLEKGDIKGVESNGRLLVATGKEDGKDTDSKKLCVPPNESKAGDKITLFPAPPAEYTPDPVCKSKQFHRILKELRTDEQGLVRSVNSYWTVSSGARLQSTVKNGTVA